METITTLLRTSLGIFIVMGAWFLWMTYVRRKSGCRGDRDVLEHMAHGCAGCRNGVCHSEKTNEEHHELT